MMIPTRVTERRLRWAVALAAAALFSPLVFVHWSTKFGEGTAFFGYPYAVIRHLVMDLKTWPLWDPYSGSGDPLLGNPVAGQFYPPMWLSLIAPTVLAGLRWSIYLHLIAAAVGSYTLARWIGCRQIPALLVPIGFLFNPYICNNMLINGLPHVIFALAWTSWGAALLWRGATEHRMGYLAAAGACLAGHVLAGTTYEMHFAILLYVFMLTWVAVSARALSWSERSARGMIQGLIVFGVAVGLSAIKLLPVFEYAPLSTRTAYSLYQVEHLDYNPTPREVWQFLVHFLDVPGIPMARSWISGIYLALAAAALWPFKRPLPWRPTVCFGLTLLVSCWAAVAYYAPLDLYAVLFHLLPGFRYSANTARILSLARLALPVLAALGATLLLQYASTRPSWIKRAVSQSLSVFVAMCLVWVCWPQAMYIYRHQSQESRLQRVEVGVAAALNDRPDLTVEGEPAAVNATVVLKNLGDVTWRRGTPVHWVVGDQVVGVSALPHQVTPSHAVTLSLHGGAIPVGAGSTLPVALRWGEPAAPAPRDLVIATLSFEDRGVSHIAVPPTTPEAIVSGAGVLGTVPGDWNARLGMLVRWHAPELFRVHSGDYSPVFAYPLLLHGAQLATYSNQSYQPKYALIVHVRNPHDPQELARLFKMFRILNVRYLIMAAGHPALDRTQIRPIRLQPEAELYELTTHLPRVWSPRGAALVLGEDPDSDLTSTEAKLAVYHPQFDPAIWAVFSRPNQILDTLTLDDLRPFQALLLTRPRIRDAAKADALLRAYQAVGGHVLQLPYAEFRYGDPYWVSNSLLDGFFPAKRLAADAQTALGQLFTSLSSDPQEMPEITLERCEPNLWRLHATTSRPMTPIIMSETYFPGWTATIDGRPALLYLADGIVRGVMVPGVGRHVIELRYQPRSLWLGALLTCSTMLGVCGIWGRRRRMLGRA